MSTRLRLADLYGGQGGAGMGYWLAGFEVVGVDINPQPRYPFEFVQMDALEFLARHGHEFDVLHASPPCQRKSKAQRIRGYEHPRLIEPTRVLMRSLGLPYVIENVPPEGDDDDPLVDPVILCGSMFGLGVYRHREFEASFPLAPPAHPLHDRLHTKMGRPPQEGTMMHVVGNFSGVAQAKRAMGIDWMSRDGLREAIPPAYTEHVGRQLTSCQRDGTIRV